MTLILALHCRDGIVMASDSQVTVPSSGGPVRQTTEKIKQIGGSTLWSGSGDVGFIQKVEETLSSLPVEIKGAGLEQLRPQIIRVIHELRKDELARQRDLYGKEEGSPSADTLFVDYKGKVPQILHIDADAKDEELQEFGYGATGIGDTFAYTLLMHYPNPKELSVEIGKFLAYLVIGDAIKVGAFGLSEPISLYGRSVKSRKETERLSNHAKLKKVRGMQSGTLVMLLEKQRLRDLKNISGKFSLNGYLNER